MLDNKPVLKERLMAGAAFAGIAMFAVAAVDLMVTGGLDFGPGQAPYDREQPSALVRMADAAQYMSDSFSSPDWSGSMFSRPPDTSESQERLAGGDDGTPPPDNFGETSGDDLYDEIAALYDDSEDGYREEADYADAPAIDADQPSARADDEAPASEDAYVSEDDAPSVSESESPW